MVVVEAVVTEGQADRVGLGWRPELAVGIQRFNQHIDVLEVIADDWFTRPANQVRALASLAQQFPLVLHGVGLGLASAHPVCERRLKQMALLLKQVQPMAWSEHLAFVRVPNVEIGHLAAPPRSWANCQGALANLARVKECVGSLPWLENIATLIDPPACSLGEAHWLDAILAGSGAGLLLDLHNVYANAINFGRDPYADLDAMPLSRVCCVHVSGGSWVDAPKAGRRWLDDHRHDPPEPVLGMLSHLAAHTDQPLTVFIERDGKYPAMSVLLDQLQAIRQALAKGRAQRQARRTRHQPVSHCVYPCVSPQAMQDARQLEIVLARLYAGELDHRAFLLDPEQVARKAGCADSDARALAGVDRPGLLHALRSFTHKRAGRNILLNH